MPIVAAVVTLKNFVFKRPISLVLIFVLAQMDKWVADCLDFVELAFVHQCLGSLFLVPFFSYFVLFSFILLYY